VATQTTSLAGHSANSAAKPKGGEPAVIGVNGRRRENIRRLADCGGTSDPNHKRAAARDLTGGSWAPGRSRQLQPPNPLHLELVQCYPV